MKIPKKIHQVWIGEKEPPAWCVKFGEEMQAMHPDWEYKLWNESNIPKLVNQDIYDKLPKHRYCFKSDIIRYEIVYKYGGVYADMDMFCYKDFFNELTYSDYFLRILKNQCRTDF